jgi:hypothetical protein
MIGLAATVALTAPSAKAEKSFTAEFHQIGVRVGYGMYTGGDFTEFNPYGLGFGLAGGHTFGSNLFLGASVEYYLGTIAAAIRDEPSANIWSAMFEPGYDLLLGNKRMMIRPQVGLGMSSLHAKACITLPPPEGEHCVEDTEYKFALAPGAMFFIDDLGGFYGQVGLRYHYVFADDNEAGVLLNAGVGAAW